MRRIDFTQHKKLINTINKYKKLCEKYGNLLTVTEENDVVINDKAANLKGTFEYYQVLLDELSKCVNDYDKISNQIKSNIAPVIKKLNAIKTCSKETF